MVQLAHALPAPAVAGARRIRHTAQAVALSGNSHECPACLGRFRHFLPWDRPDVVCPRCGSLERHRRAILFLRRHTDIHTAPLRVLHVAPEEALRREIEPLPSLDYVAGDLFPDARSVRLDVTAIDAADASFDVVLCSHVLEHVPDDAKALSEIRRVLRPDGWALLGVPVNPTLDAVYEDATITDEAGRLTHFGQADHVRWYTDDGFQERVRAAGLDVTAEPVAFSAWERDRYLLGTAEWDRVYLCRPV
ncbi:class I SAM-dependent methyltransferase [Motilibacter aurantiacus]|uniref:class I SAM-dependent methyltransferase n=1 Tax=Motilibacter aurantiacus TaxID=2714955 RepID=UPI00140E2A46|nr:class I SAM-dependent methyltransferase [Motilibacter aurantiacus]NHC46169.1 class I SAM-dependent methyltransferase [Motilibacter aurantiacus]